MQNNSSENKGTAGANRVLKYILLAFVAASAGAAIYKFAAGSGQTPTVPRPVEVEAAAPAAKRQNAPAGKPGTKTVAAVKKPAKTAAEAKTAIVYYFHTNARCYSCKTLEAYTREAVEMHFASDHNGWKVEFKGVDVEEEAGKHFVQDYRLNSKSVVVQKFSGGKALKYAKLEKVWQLLGDKDAFMKYVADETHKLLDGV